MDIPAMFGGAVAEFDARVRQIGEHQWRAATPDEGWAVPTWSRCCRQGSVRAAAAGRIHDRRGG